MGIKTYIFLIKNIFRGIRVNSIIENEDNEKKNEDNERE